MNGLAKRGWRGDGVVEVDFAVGSGEIGDLLKWRELLFLLLKLGDTGSNGNGADGGQVPRLDGRRLCGVVANVGLGVFLVWKRDSMLRIRCGRCWLGGLCIVTNVGLGVFSRRPPP